MAQKGLKGLQLKKVSSPGPVYREIQAAKASAVTDNAALEAKFMVLESAVSVGGGATENFTVTGLLTTDVLLAVTQDVKGANNLPLLGYSLGLAGHLNGVYSADPGAGAKVKVFIKRG